MIKSFSGQVVFCFKTGYYFFTGLQRSSKGKYFNPLSVIIFLPASTRRNLKQETSNFSVPVICDQWLKLFVLILFVIFCR